MGWDEPGEGGRVGKPEGLHKAGWGLGEGAPLGNVFGLKSPSGDLKPNTIPDESHTHGFIYCLSLKPCKPQADHAKNTTIIQKM